MVSPIEYLHNDAIKAVWGLLPIIVISFAEMDRPPTRSHS